MPDKKRSGREHHDDCFDEDEDFFESVTAKYFPYGIDDESVDGKPFTPTPGAW